MASLRRVPSLALVVLTLLPACSLVLDTDPADPQKEADLGSVDLGSADLGSVDLGSADLGSADLGSVDLGIVDGAVEPVDSGAPDSGSCVSSEQCDDGVFCNGYEQCVAGTCVTSPVMCRDADGVACTQPRCDPMLDECIEAPDDARCAAREYCDATDGCVRRPDCVTSSDCTAPDACTVGVCVAGRCDFPPLDCAGLLPPLDPADCRVPSCNRATGCFYAPSDARCDDGVDCTQDVCGVGGRCRADPRSARCDDGATCTDDTCDPVGACMEPSGGAFSGCKYTPNDEGCSDYAAELSTRFEGLACARAVCIGATAGNAAGCGFMGGCGFGERCDVAGGGAICVPGGRSCTEDRDCSDDNPCNGVEQCTSGRNCIASLTDPCRLTPSGPTTLGTCAFAGGDSTPFCAPFTPCSAR